MAGLLAVSATLLLAYALYEVLKAVVFALRADASQFPGPLLNRLSIWPLKLAVLGGRRSQYIHDLHKQYGEFVIIAPNEVSTTNTDAFKEIHKIGTKFTKGPWYWRLTPLQYNDETGAVFMLRNARAAIERRKLIQQAGNRGTVVTWESFVTAKVDETIAQIRKDALAGSADLVKWWSLMACDVLMPLAFAENTGMVGAGEKTQMVQDIEQAMIFAGIYGELPLLWDFIKYLPLPGLGKPIDFFERLLEYGRRAAKNCHAAWDSKSHITLFSKMVPEDSSQQRVPDKIIEQEASNLIIAGVEPVAVALIYLVYSVLSNEEIKKKLLSELKQVPDRPTWAQLEALPYLNATVQETVRMYSPVMGTLPRMGPPEGCMLGGYHIHPTLVVGTQAYSMHRKTDVYEDPDTFKPERWLNATPQMRECFQGFGGSARVCLGQNLARLEMLQAVARLFKQCPELHLDSKTDAKSMALLDYFVIKPVSGHCWVKLK